MRGGKDSDMSEGSGGQCCEGEEDSDTSEGRGGQ